MSNKKEVVVCAAVRISAVKDGFKGSHIIKGINYETIRLDGFLSEVVHPTWCVAYESGFITNLNRFISPQEALKLTGRQHELRFQNRDYLLPEDLY